MPLYEHDRRRPQVHPTARIAPTATIVGDVVIGAGCSIGFGAVVVAESGPVRIGTHCVIMDTAVLRGTKKDTLTLGDNVIIGPHASLVGCTVEENAFLATGVVGVVTRSAGTALAFARPDHPAIAWVSGAPFR